MCSCSRRRGLYHTCRPFYGSSAERFGYRDDRVVIVVFMLILSERRRSRMLDATAAAILIGRTCSLSDENLRISSPPAKWFFPNRVLFLFSKIRNNICVRGERYNVGMLIISVGKPPRQHLISLPTHHITNTPNKMSPRIYSI